MTTEFGSLAKDDITTAERQAYISGALEVCVRLQLPEERVAWLCMELRIKPEELIEARTAACAKVKCK